MGAAPMDGAPTGGAPRNVRPEDHGRGGAPAPRSTGVAVLLSPLLLRVRARRTRVRATILSDSKTATPCTAEEPRHRTPPWTAEVRRTAEERPHGGTAHGRRPHVLSQHGRRPPATSCQVMDGSLRD